MPFLPLYFRQLGVEDVGEIALWSGLSLGATPAITALLAPFWGRLGDRFGRKIMVERSLASFVVVMAATAFVTKAWHVLALRAVQGLFAGYGALAITMAAESVPRERMARAIGQVQTAQRLGPALGPIFGGVVAQIVGLRNAFLVTALSFAIALVLVFVLYQEPVTKHPGEERDRGPVRFRTILAFENFVLLMVVIFGLQFVDRSFGPVLPLYLEQLGTPSGANSARGRPVVFDRRGNRGARQSSVRIAPAAIDAAPTHCDERRRRGRVCVSVRHRAGQPVGLCRHADLWCRHRHRHHRRLHGRRGGDSVQGPRCRLRFHEHRVSDGRGAQSDRQRTARRDEHTRRLPARWSRPGRTHHPRVEIDDRGHAAKASTPVAEEL